MYKTFFTHARQTPVRLLVNSLFVALLAISTTQALAQTSPTPSPKKTQSTQPTQPANPIAKKLLGTWEVKNPRNPSSSESLKFIFTPAGKLLIVMSPGVSGTPLVYETRYEINSKPKPMHLDVTLPTENQKVQTIFEFTNDDKLRVELYESNPGKSRPTTFPTRTPLFEKISSSTNLPKDAKVVEPGRPKTPATTTPENKPAPPTTTPENKPAPNTTTPQNKPAPTTTTPENKPAPPTSEPENNSGNSTPKK